MRFPQVIHRHGSCKRRHAPLESGLLVSRILVFTGAAMGKPLICIGELLHASIPDSGRAMQEIQAAKEQGKPAPREPLDYVHRLIESQARDGADYVAVNVDAFGEKDPRIAVDMMVEYVAMVRERSGGVPVCVDSSDDRVLVAGLKSWYDGGKNVPPPLLNSVKVYTVDNILPLKKLFEFSFVGMLVGAEPPSGPGGSYSVEQLCGFAEELFDQAVDVYGFRAGQIFFDTTVFPLAIDMPMEAGLAGYTYRTFETIRRIKNDPKFAGVHFTAGLSNCARDLPGRKIGVCRAYAAKAVEAGLDSVIANPAHHFGRKEPDPELVRLVEAYAKMDGSLDSTTAAMELMSLFCRSCREAE